MPFVIQSADSLANRSLCHVQCATSYSLHIQILAVLPHSTFHTQSIPCNIVCTYRYWQCCHTPPSTDSIPCNMACTYRYWLCCHTPPSTHRIYHATWHAHTDTGSVATLYLPHTHTQYTMQHGMHTKLLAVLPHSTFHTQTTPCNMACTHMDTGSVATPNFQCHMVSKQGYSDLVATLYRVFHDFRA
jgi:hypothetical protein